VGPTAGPDGFERRKSDVYVQFGLTRVSECEVRTIRFTLLSMFVAFYTRRSTPTHYRRG
jgi:hypothetical protein